MLELQELYNISRIFTQLYKKHIFVYSSCYREFRKAMTNLQKKVSRFENLEKRL